MNEENIKNYTDEQAKNALAAVSKKYDEQLKNTIIHIMPKKYVKVEMKNNQSRGVGILILLGGFLLMVLVFALLYYFVFAADPLSKKTVEVTQDNTLPVEEDKEEIKKEETTKKEDTEPVKEEKKTEESNEDIEVKEELATSTEDIATSTNATSTIVIEFEEKATSSDENISKEDDIEVPDYKLALDTDNDGLSDMEEMVFDSDMEVADSDGDSYDDLSELVNLYNPSGEGKIDDNTNIERYTNTKYGYSLLYPKSWLNSSIGDESSIIFKSGNNQFIQVMVLDNEDDLKLEDYYKKQYDTDRLSKDQSYEVDGWSGIRSEGGFDVYLTRPDFDKIVLITYNLGLDNVLYYKNIYEMMLKSFKILE